MSFLVTETPEGLSLRSEIVGPGSRALASLLDLAIFIFGVLVLGFSLVLLGASLPELAEVLGIWLQMGAALALMFYQPFCALLMKGQTPGKKLLGLQVADEDGLPATFFQHLVRGMFWPLEMLPFPLPIGVMCMAGSQQRQRLGDRVAGTLILRQDSGELPADPFPNVDWKTLSLRRLALVPAHSSRFDERDFLFLRELIGRRDVDRVKHESLMRRSLKHYLNLLELKIGARPNAREIRALLSELYVFLRHMRKRS